MTNLNPLKPFGFCLAAMLVSAPVLAQPVEAFLLIPSDIEGPEDTAHLHDQGYALRGSRLRLGIRADQLSKVSLKYSNPAGDETELLQNVELTAGTVVMIPSDKDWFTLDGEPGPYNFVLETGSGFTVSQKVNLLPAVSPPADLMPATEVGQMSVPRTLPAVLKANIRSAKEFKGNKIIAPEDISLRGVGGGALQEDCARCCGCGRWRGRRIWLNHLKRWNDPHELACCPRTRRRGDLFQTAG